MTILLHPDIEDYEPTQDMLAWAKASQYCEVDVKLFPHGSFPYESTGMKPAHYMLVLGFLTESTGFSVGAVAVEFDTAGKWLSVSIQNLTAWSHTLPSAKDGYTTLEAAEITLLQVERDTGAKSWANYRRTRNKWKTEQARADSEERLALMARDRIARRIRVEALEMIAGQHEEEFVHAWEAAQVAHALRSDWFPNS